MPVYINPSKTSKEQWLHAHAGVPASGDILCYYKEIRRRKAVPVCLFDNGHFEVAGVAFYKDEAKTFARIEHKKWFIVPLVALTDDTGIAPAILKAI